MSNEGASLYRLELPMILGTQYYRPPFPDRKYWQDDLSKMRDSGLNAVQLWAVWGWIEAEPGVFNFDDYDTLVTEAQKRGLGVVISCIAEIHPFWLPRLLPDSHLVDHLGRPVPSVGRREVNVGLTPGGCFDHPGVRERMGRFIESLAERYARAPNLLGWDAWNETRWNVLASGHTCYCTHTIAAFREWLKTKYDDLAGLSAAWKRRYTSWDDVYPGRYTGALPTELMEFCDFLSWRAAMHMRFRYHILKSVNPGRLVSAHGAQPCVMSAGGGYEQPLCRGSDWDHAAELDGFGCSHFPFWGSGFDLASFGTRVEVVRSACRGKVAWVSELQGGAANAPAFTHSRSVPAGPQQRWVWTGYSRGCKAALFWCWRDEVFGQESSGFGLSGRDGLADERLSAMRQTAKALSDYGALLDDYEPDPAQVGIFFDRANHFRDYAAHGDATRSAGGLTGYALALERLNVPYRFIESRYMDDLKDLKLLVMPFAVIVDDEASARIAEFVQQGGTVLLEAETGACTSLGFYNGEPADRRLTSALGIEDLGRREFGLAELVLRAERRQLKLKPSTLHAPLKQVKGDKVLAKSGSDVLGLLRSVGKGRVVALGTFLGDPYRAERYTDFEDFVSWLVDLAEVERMLEVKPAKASGDFHWRCGTSGGERLLFLSTGPATSVNISDRNGFGEVKVVEEILSGKTYKVGRERGMRRVMLRLARDSVAVLRWSPK